MTLPSYACESVPDQPGLVRLSETERAQLVRTSDISEQYSVERTPFARGKFAAVRKCCHLVDGGQFAAKFVHRRRGNRSAVGGAVGGSSSWSTVHVHHELAVLAAARAAATAGDQDAARVVRLHAAYVTPTESALVLEMMNGGDLQQVIDADECLDESCSRVVLRHTLKALHFLHNSLNIAHLDIKPQNILLSGQLPDCQVKLCDFGLSRRVDDGCEVREIMGTPDYVAPEVLQYEPVSLATDMWSVGVLAYVLLSGHSPFAGDTKQETLCNVTQARLDFPAQLFDSVTSSARHFIAALVVVKASERLDTVSCLSHAWLRENEQQPQDASSPAAAPATSSTPQSPAVVTAPVAVMNGHNRHDQTSSSTCAGGSSTGSRSPRRPQQVVVRRCDPPSPSSSCSHRSPRSSSTNNTSTADGSSKVIVLDSSMLDNAM